MHAIRDRAGRDVPATAPQGPRAGAQGPRAGARTLVLLAALCAGCGGPADNPSDAPPPERRNLILIVVDTLRADHLGANGGALPTPSMDALAAAGVLFREARSQIPATGPSHASLFTSSLPSDHGTRVNSQHFDDANLTLAEILGRHGWRTAAFVSLGVLSARFGFDQGFDEYSDWFEGRWWKSADVVNAGLRRWASRDQHGPLFLFLHYSDPHTPYAPPDVDYPQVALRHRARTLAVLHADARSEPVEVQLQPGANDIELIPPDGTDRAELGCGLVIPSDDQVGVQFACEGDFEPGLDDGRVPPCRALPRAIRLVNPTPEPLLVTVDVTLRMNLDAGDWPGWYAREVAFVDARLGRAVAVLKRAGLWKNSIVVFTSDHGEGLGEHRLQQHVEQLYDSLLRVPLIVVAPGLLPAGKVIDVPVQHMDVLPTVLELLGVSTGRPMRGRSLVSLARGEGPATARPILGETHRPDAQRELRSLVFNGFKYIVDTQTGAEELYALTDDPGELHDISIERPDLLARLRSTLAEQDARRFGPELKPPGLPALTEEERARMAELGYTR